MIRDQLRRILAAGPLNIGEIQVRQLLDASFSLRHWRDADPDKSVQKPLRILTDPLAARDLARFDDQNRYRPLKGAPTLPTGWELQLDSLASVRLALDCIYPGALASWIAWRQKRVQPIDLRTTLSRQTGMYRVAGDSLLPKPITWLANSAGLTGPACGQSFGRSMVIVGGKSAGDKV